MKKIFFLIISFFIFTNNSFALVDNSIQLELDKNKTTEIKNEAFQMKTYDSCQAVDSLINDYIKKYSSWRFSTDKILFSPGLKTLEVTNSVASENTSSNDFSKTNTQVSWVDEAEIVKTDWKNIFYFSEKWNEKFIYIVSVDKKEIIKKIKIPESFYSVSFYLSWEKLVLTWNLYRENLFAERNFYYNQSENTFVIVYDISDLTNLKLEKFFILNWSYSDSRFVWDKVYVVSNNDFSFSYGEKFFVHDSIPWKIDIFKNSFEKFSVLKWKSSNCSDLEFILPDEKYFKENGFSLSYNIVSTIDLKNSSTPVKTKVIASNSRDFYMNEKNLYLTSDLSFYNWFSCINCFLPSYSWNRATLVNKFSLDNWNLSYKKSIILDWKPLTQYSMDEDKNWNFRILTQITNWRDLSKNYTNFYILDKDLNLVSKLEKLWEKENFKSSRYIWDKLFLVTFEQVDPLFVIDLKDVKNPKILWELKIPGYSTYLHPYDENHLIWLWYDTKENSWWWVQNSWIKLDLYQINYDKKCWDLNLTKEENEKCEKWDYKWIIVKQLFTKTFWWSWSYSEALNNPRMFVWNSVKNKLFLPVSLKDYSNTNNKDNFIWLLALTINKNSWIKQDFRVTNIDLDKVEKQRQEECKQYDKAEEKVCKTLVSGKQVCWYENISSIPNYCLQDSTIFDYLSNNSWKFSESSINRALWIWNNFYSLSPDRIKANNMDSGKEVLNIELK